MQCERCGACCQDFAVLITFSDIIRILHHYPEYSLRSITQLYLPKENEPDTEFLSKYPQISIFEEGEYQTGYLILNWNPEKWNSRSSKIMCTFYDYKGEKCLIHDSNPRTCQVYPFMKESDVVDRPNRRCPHLFNADILDPNGLLISFQMQEEELQSYWKHAEIWNLFPLKKKTWRNLSIFLRLKKFDKPFFL